MESPAATFSTPNEPVLIERHGPVTLLRLHRPDARNALNQPMFDALIAALDAAEADDDVRVVVLTGDERAFAAGADLRELATLTPLDAHRLPRKTQWDRLRRLRKPLIAAVTGVALGGGCELALACDLIIAGENARFGQPEITLGLMPGGGGTQRLARAVGKARAMELILTGRTLSAQEAYEAGLVTRLTPTEGCLPAALRLAEEIAAKPPLAIELAKEAVLFAFEAPLETGLALERRSFELLFATEDHAEGIAAFLGKRPPRFTGR